MPFHTLVDYPDGFREPETSQDPSEPQPSWWDLSHPPPPPKEQDMPFHHVIVGTAISWAANAVYDAATGGGNQDVINNDPWMTETGAGPGHRPENGPPPGGPSPGTNGSCVKTPTNYLRWDKCGQKWVYTGRRRRRRRMLTAGDRNDITFLKGILGGGQLGQAAITSAMTRGGS